VLLIIVAEEVNDNNPSGCPDDSSEQ